MRLFVDVCCEVQQKLAALFISHPSRYQKKTESGHGKCSEKKSVPSSDVERSIVQSFDVLALSFEGRHSGI